MAQDEMENGDDVAVAAPADNARDLTSGLVFATTVMLLIGFLVAEKALAKFFGVGLFA